MNLKINGKRTFDVPGAEYNSDNWKSYESGFYDVNRVPLENETDRVLIFYYVDPKMSEYPLYFTTPLFDDFIEPEIEESLEHEKTMNKDEDIQLRILCISKAIECEAENIVECAQDMYAFIVGLDIENDKELKKQL